ncbi:MAG: transglycosylase SLT domain-containing protein [Peptostreptococcaceae bacterium]
MNRIKEKMNMLLWSVSDEILYFGAFVFVALYLGAMGMINFTLSRKLSSYESANSKYNKEIVSLKNRSAELENIILEKDKTIVDIKNKINIANIEIERLSNKPKPIIEKKVTVTKVSKLKFNEDIKINTKSGKPTVVKKEILNAIYKYSKVYNVDPEFIAGMIYVESRFNPKAVNTIHYGLGQVNNTVTGPWLHKLSKADGVFSKDRLFDIDYNIQLTSSYVGYLNKKYKGNILLAMKEYSGNSKVEGAQKYLDDVNRFKSRNLFNFK